MACGRLRRPRPRCLLQSLRNKRTVLRLIRKLLKSQDIGPRVTEKLRCYGAAKAELMLGVEHQSHKGLNNRAKNSHLPLRQRERLMMRFKSARQCQRFVSVHGPVSTLFQILTSTEATPPPEPMRWGSRPQQLSCAPGVGQAIAFGPGIGRIEHVLVRPGDPAASRNFRQDGGQIAHRGGA